MVEDNRNRDIESVFRHWNLNPVHSIEFKQDVDIETFKTYVNEIDSLRWADNERWARERFYEFASGEGKRLLDAGCGIGVLTRFFAKRGYEVHAIDLTTSAVEATRQSLEALGLQAEVKLGNVEQLAFPDNCFDYVVSNGVIHHTPDTEKAVGEFYRVLKPGGLASVCVYYKNILLRQPIFTFMKLMLPVMLNREKMEGRESAFSAKTPEDFVGVYDGNYTPISKVYSRKQGDELFKRFHTVAVETHYFPIRFLKLFSVGGMIHRILDKYCGVLIYYLLEKRAGQKAVIR